MSLIWRRIAGVAVLVAFALVAVAVVPPYLHNWRFQGYLDDVVQRPQLPEIMQATVVGQAAELGLPVRTGAVHVVRNGNGVRVDIVYVVKVDFPLYSVDLHFHPSATTE